MNTIIEKIRAEIERRITDNTFGAKLELIDILAWLNTLESENPTTAEGLEEEIKRWLKEGKITDTRYDDYGDNDIESTARHFAQWGAEHLADARKTSPNDC